MGHETDFSIADFVADVRAPTPSAAAEIVSKESATMVTNLKRAKSSLAQFLNHILEISFQKIDDTKDRLDQTYKHLILRLKGLLQSRKAHLESLLPAKQVAHQRARLNALKKQFTSFERILSEKRKALKYISDHLYAIHPKTTLKKGYCICFQENKDSAIIRAKDVQVSQNISLLFYDGEIDTTVIKVRHEL